MDILFFSIIGFFTIKFILKARKARFTSYFLFL